MSTKRWVFAVSLLLLAAAFTPGVASSVSQAILTVVQPAAANLNASVGGLGASGAAVVGSPARIGGSDGTNTRDILTDAAGNLNVDLKAMSSGAALNPQYITYCDQSAAVSVTAGTTVQIVAPTVGRVIHVCHYVLTCSANCTAQMRLGTGTTCGTGTFNYNSPYFIGANLSISAGIGIADLLYTNSGDAFCIAATGGNVQGMISFASRIP